VAGDRSLLAASSGRKPKTRRPRSLRAVTSFLQPSAPACHSPDRRRRSSLPRRPSANRCDRRLRRLRTGTRLSRRPEASESLRKSSAHCSLCRSGATGRPRSRRATRLWPRRSPHPDSAWFFRLFHAIAWCGELVSWAGIVGARNENRRCSRPKRRRLDCGDVRGVALAAWGFGPQVARASVGSERRQWRMQPLAAAEALRRQIPAKVLDFVALGRQEG
jgi:hypothetical protein